MKLTIPPNKSYQEDIKIFHKALLDKKNFSFSKFCDGEWAVIKNQPINNKEFWFDPNNPQDQYKRASLINSFQFDHPNYFVGITCVNVFGLETHRAMKKICGLPECKLTWADIWVNSNYSYYIKNIIPVYRNRQTVLFCNAKSQVSNLPFEPRAVFSISYNAWEDNWSMIEEAKKYIAQNNIQDHIFLFCCGPFGNILCHQLTQFNDRNTYLDIGSTLNPLLQSAGFERDYYMGNNFFSNLIGAWE
jgi:hypothetical protein